MGAAVVFGAIFLQEMLIAGRRQRSYFLRWTYAFILLVQLVPWALAALAFDAHRPGSSAAGAFARFLDSFTVQHFYYLFALTPALAAGAIADEKTRGTLDYLLTTCLSPAEIVVGKMLARACQVMTVALVALPIVCFFGVSSDLDAAFIVALVAASAVLIVGIAALSLLASVWCRKTRDAVLCTYLALVAGTLLLRAFTAAPWSFAAEALSPWHVTSIDERDGRWLRLAVFSMAWLMLAVPCTVLAAWRLRSASSVSVPRKRIRIWRWAHERAMPDEVNPVLWRERSVQGIAPMARLRAIPIWLAAPLVALACAAGLAIPVWLQLPPNVDLLGAFLQDGLLGLHEAFRDNGISGWDVATTHGHIVWFIVTLLVAVRASGSITDERERGTWDALLLTPIDTRAIVGGKFWGVLLASAPYLFAYAAGTLAVAFLISFHTFVATVIAIGAVLVYLPWVAAAGVWCSALIRSSWRSLLATLGIVYASLTIAFLLFVVSCFVSGPISLALALLLSGDGRMGGNRMDGIMSLLFPLLWGGTTLSLVALAAWFTSIGLLSAARSRIDRRERAHVTWQESEMMQMLPRLDRLAEELADEERERDYERR
jgi:ABC-type transport system involved in multi-copper enzyme maturation permease subunit